MKIFSYFRGHSNLYKHACQLHISLLNHHGRVNKSFYNKIFWKFNLSQLSVKYRIMALFTICFLLGITLANIDIDSLKLFFSIFQKEMNNVCSWPSYLYWWWIKQVHERLHQHQIVFRPLARLINHCVLNMEYAAFTSSSREIFLKYYLPTLIGKAKLAF